MNEEKGSEKKLDKFFDGKGFYIVLSLCIALLGVSTYFLLADNRTDVEDESTLAETYSSEYDDNDYQMTENIPEEATVIEEDELRETQEEDETAVWNEETASQVSTAMIWPVNGEIELPYSVTSLVYNRKMGDWRTNDSVEIAAPLGTQVLASGSGTVEKIYRDDLNGMTVIIAHAGGLRSSYANLAAVPTVFEGDNIMTGEVIASVGTTAVGETEENPHLCFSMTLDGQSVDPADYLPAR